MRFPGLCSSLRGRGVLLALLLISGGAFAQRQPGVAPRAKPDDYAVHVTTGDRTYAASVLSADEVKHLFAFDISKNYVVLEVALYPNAGAPMNIDPDSFVVDAGKDKDVVRRADAITVAADIQQKNTPKPPSASSPIYTEANVGYESGTDPNTGRRVHGTYGGAGVGVGGPSAPQPPSPGGWPQDRDALQWQLQDRSLPAGRVDRPIAGYLYFSTVLLKKNKEVYKLKYLGDPPDAAQLEVPAKSH